MRIGRLALSAGAAAIVAALLAWGLPDLAWLKARQGALVTLYRAQPALFVIGFVAAQALALTLLIPGAVLLFALAAGAVIGWPAGVPVLLAGLTIGDSLNFLVARYLLRGWAERRFGAAARRMRDGVARGGASYLLALRLFAAVPYFVTNVAMALTPMRLRVFAPVSLLGLIPASLLYVNAGTQLGRIERAGDILSFPILASFAALALVPLGLRWWWVRRR